MKMTDIKTREHVRDIKVLDKSQVIGERMKNALIRSRNQTQDMMKDGESSPTEYAENRIRYVVEDTASVMGHEVKHQVDRKIEQGRNAYGAHRREVLAEKKARKVDEALRRYDATYEISAYRNQRQPYTRGRERTMKHAEKSKKTMRQKSRPAKGASIKEVKATVKAREKGVKTAKRTSRTAIKTVEATAKAAEKTAQASAKAAKASARATQEAAKATELTIGAVLKVTAAIGKAIITGVSSLIAALVAAGGTAVIVVVVICMIGLVAGSGFGIFFFSEDTGSDQTMYEVVQEINDGYLEEIEEIKISNPHDKLEMSGSRAVWPEVLSFYAVKVTTDPDHAQEVATVTDEKKEILKEIFWEMNEISYSTSTKEETKIIESDDGNGNIIKEEVKESITTLRIAVSHKTADEMAQEYGFDEDQKEQLAALLDPENHSMWTNVLYGVYAADDQIVAVAYSQLGNVGGQPYWSWYGFDSRVEWCACFVSWCANECGYIDTGVIPKFALCSIGAQWFQDRGQWGDNSMEPVAGTIIFFDWDGDHDPDHVGIVEYTENGIVHTIEGNSGDTCRTRQYAVGSSQIYGYGAVKKE